MKNIHHIAMTAAEISAAAVLPPGLGWMACHFAPGNPGLSNLPRQLPPDSLLILDDSNPPAGHDPAVILAQLICLTKQLSLSGVLLDFQRPDDPETRVLTELLVKYLPCPVCVSELYARPLDAPVFLPPPPLCSMVDTYLQPWQGREIWMELAPEAEQVTVTEQGAEVLPLSPFPDTELPFFCPETCCRYSIRVLEDWVSFTLCRQESMLPKLQEAAADKGVSHFVSLYHPVQ